MTYTDRYNAIIHYFQRHPVDRTKIYCECHHIVPASCGGSNKKENLVNLPAAWHYRVHCYLPFVMLEQGKQCYYYKMLCAWRRCLNSTKDRIDLMKINAESREYKRLREECSKEIGKINAINQLGENNSHFKHHWWKDPNDKTKSLSIKEGDPVPEGWVRGKWQLQSENTRCIINNETGIHKYINKDLPTPDGWHVFEKPIKFKIRRINHKQHKLQKEKRVKKEKTFKVSKEYSVHITMNKHCKWCGAEIIRGKKTCKHPEICYRMRIIPKMIQFFGFDESSIGSERFYEEYNKIKDYLYDLYFVQKKSLDDICKIIKYTPGPGPFANFMKSIFGKKSLRPYTESSALAWKHGKMISRTALGTSSSRSS